MSDFTFTNALGKVAYYATLPGVNDAFIAVPLTTAGHEPDSTLMDKVTLADLLSGTTDEQTTLGRKTLTAVTTTVVGGTMVVDVPDFTFVGATGAPISSIVMCYDPDVTSGSDSDIILLTKHDFSAIPSGSDIPVQISADGLFVASPPA